MLDSRNNRGYSQVNISCAEYHRIRRDTVRESEENAFECFSMHMN